MEDWFNIISARCELSPDALRELRNSGFSIIAGPIASDRLEQFAEAYDSAVTEADADDVLLGSSTTRVSDFVNRSPEFDGLYTYEPILGACCRTIGAPFKLSTMHARTVRPHASAQDLHVDFRRTGDGWPMVGFILMVDEFRPENGATRFVLGSHNWPSTPADSLKDSKHYKEVVACGPAGSIIVYNGSVWHGHTANRVDEPRRSIQGAYIRRDAEAAVNQAARIRPETLARIGGLAKYLLAL